MRCANTLVRSLTNFSCLLDVEPVRDERKVGVDEAHELRDSLLDGVAGVEEHLDPAAENR